MIAQLRDILSAKDSSIVAKEDEYRWSYFPKGTEADILAVWIREFNGGEGRTQGVGVHRRNDTAKSPLVTGIVPYSVRQEEACYQFRLEQ